MRILIAIDKFKGSLTAPDAARAIAAGIQALDPSIDVDTSPLADGGEGTVDALVSATDGTLMTCRVTGPLPDMKVGASFGLLGDTSSADNERQGGAGRTAVVEMSAASGLHLLASSDRNPANTTTYGTGQLLLEAAKLGVRRIILGIGGSATIDAGVGCCQACALPVILDSSGPADIHEPLVGSDLERIVLIKHARGLPLDRIPIEVASDVTNPLYGPTGAACIFGPQKGATPRQVEQFDSWHRRLAQRCDAVDIANRPGAGAAGGLGFAMMAFFNATLRPGFDIVADAVNLPTRLARADLVITGEGRLDASSLHGKVPVAVARLCRDKQIPCIGLAGTVDRAASWQDLFFTTHAITDLEPNPEAAIARAAGLLTSLTRQALSPLLERRPQR